MSPFSPTHLNTRYHLYSPLITYHLPICTSHPPQIKSTYLFVYQDYLEFQRRLRESEVERETLGLGEGMTQRVAFWDGITAWKAPQGASSVSTAPAVTTRDLQRITLPKPSPNSVWVMQLEQMQFRLEMIANEVPLTVVSLTLRIICNELQREECVDALIHLDYIDFTWLPQFLFTTEHLGIALEYYTSHIKRGDKVHSGFSGEGWIQGVVQNDPDAALIRNTMELCNSETVSSPKGSHRSANGKNTPIIDLNTLTPHQQITLVQRFVKNIRVKWQKPPPAPKTKSAAPDDAAESMIDPLDRTTIDPTRTPISNVSCWELQEVIAVPQWEQRLSGHRPLFEEDLRFYFLEKLYAFTSSKNHANLQYLNYRYPYPITAVLVYDRLNQHYYRNLEAFQLDLVHLLQCLSADAREHKLNTLGRKAVKALHKLVEEFNHIIAERKIDRVLQPKKSNRVLKRKRLQFTMMIPEASEMDESAFQREGRLLGASTTLFPFSGHIANGPHFFYSKIEAAPLIVCIDDKGIELELEDRAPFMHDIQCKSLYVCKWQDKQANKEQQKRNALRGTEHHSPTTMAPITPPNKDTLMNTTVEMLLTPSQRNAFKLLMTSIDNAMLQDDKKSELDELILQKYSFLKTDHWRWCTSGFYFKTERMHLKTERSTVLCEVLHLCAVKNSLHLEMQHPCADIKLTI